jgi:hypothetical protein
LQIKTVFRLYSCLFYELIIQIALWFVITFLILFFFNFKAIEHPNIFLFILWVSSGIYFLYSWMYGGQTLAMKAWKLKLIPPKDHKFIFFLLRYVLATLGVALLLLFYLNILFGGREYMHDLILDSKIILVQI